MIDVKLWEAEFKEKDRDRLEPKLYRRGLHGQPKIIVKTKRGTIDLSQFTVDNIIQCLQDNGYGELPEELGQDALDNYFDMRQGKAESIQDYIFREEIFTVALKKDTAIDLDEKIRGYWVDENIEPYGSRSFLESKSSLRGRHSSRRSRRRSLRQSLQRNVRRSEMICEKQEIEHEIELKDMPKPRISILMETVMMTKTGCQNQSAQNHGMIPMQMNRKL